MNETAILTAQAIPTTQGYQLRVTLWNPTDTARSLTLRYQLLLTDGTIVNGNEPIPVAANTAAFERVFKLAEGNLITAAIFANGSVIQQGEVYASLDLLTGDVNNSQYTVPLVAGYVTAYCALSYPYSQNEPQNSGQGAFLEFAPTDPAVGFEINFSFPSNTIVEILAMSYTFVADANAANRFPTTSFVSAAGTTQAAGDPAAVTAGTTRNYVLNRGSIQQQISTGVLQQATANTIFLRNGQITTTTTGIQVGDAFSNIRISTRLWVSI